MKNRSDWSDTDNILTVIIKYLFYNDFIWIMQNNSVQNRTMVYGSRTMFVFSKLFLSEWFFVIVSGYNVPSRPAPHWLVCFLSLFMADAKAILPRFGKENKMDNSRVSLATVPRVNSFKNMPLIIISCSKPNFAPEGQINERDLLP
jgi:hypothetical protein